MPHAASYRDTMDEGSATSTADARGTQPPVPTDATRPPAQPATGQFTERDAAIALGARKPQPTGYPTTTSSEQHNTAGDNVLPQLHPRHHLALSRSNSQATTSTNDADPVFTPPASGGKLSPGVASVHGSSQDSQLLQLSQIAAAQERIPEDTIDLANGVSSRKRMADGMVKHARHGSTVSPGQATGHSRNTSTVSVASTAGSRIGELSAELKTRLSYAMVKVNHGWQSHSIDQVESLASQAASPASSTSTIHLRNGSSSSPQLSSISHHRDGNNTTPATATHHPSSGRTGDSHWAEATHSASRASSTSPVKTAHGLAPPVSIQPSQPQAHPRRGSILKNVPAFPFSASYPGTSHSRPHHDSPGQPSPYLGPGQRHRAEGILVSPHTNVREQDAIESLLFMSSPGNSANLKHAFPASSAQPLSSSHQQNTPQQRTALPTSQPRKSLPTGRPPQHARSQSQTHKRVGFEKSPTVMMDVDDPPPPFGSPMSVTRGTPRKRINGGHQQHHQHHQHHGEAAAATRLKQFPVSAGLTLSSKPRPALAEEDIDRMLERAANAEDSDSDDGEIRIPAQRARRDGAQTQYVGA
ncbi:hypothetical protein VTK26DRAFT_6762 [Humicola hyalothermophila]